jgi:hypothetical protein
MSITPQIFIGEWCNLGQLQRYSYGSSLFVLVRVDRKTKKLRRTEMTHTYSAGGPTHSIWLRNAVARIAGQVVIHV